MNKPQPQSEEHQQARQHNQAKDRQHYRPHNQTQDRHQTLPHQQNQPTLVMGILNVTDDSFSDGGRYANTDAALAHARQMLADGADIIDVGGESTRPGATRVPAEQEAARIRPVIEQLSRDNVVTSIDTMRASTAEAAIQAGATIINDVSGGLADPDMLPLAAQSGVDIVLMHWKTEAFGEASGYQDHGDIVTTVTEHLLRRADAAVAAGVDARRIIVDPGIGFAKSPQDNWRLLQATAQINETCSQHGYRLLIGASRKRFLTALRPATDGLPGTPESADDATAALTAIAATQGAWAVRVHNVPRNRAAVDVAHAVAVGAGPDVPEQWRARRGQVGLTDTHGANIAHTDGANIDRTDGANTTQAGRIQRG